MVELELTCKGWHSAIVDSKCWRMILSDLLNQEATLARIAIEIRQRSLPEVDNLAYKRLYFKVRVQDEEGLVFLISIVLINYLFALSIVRSLF